jgi:hypothetical protein
MVNCKDCKTVMLRLNMTNIRRISILPYSIYVHKENLKEYLDETLLFICEKCKYVKELGRLDAIKYRLARKISGEI